VGPEVKRRVNVTLSPEAATILDKRENVSEYLDALVCYAKAHGLPETVAGLRWAVLERASRAGCADRCSCGHRRDAHDPAGCLAVEAAVACSCQGFRS